MQIAVSRLRPYYPTCYNLRVQDAILVFETIHGSQAYHLATDTSDVDVRGVFVSTPRQSLGFLPAPEQIDLSKDHVLFEIRKFFRLASASNPTVVEILFTDPSCHRCVTAVGRRLLEHRHEFLSRKAGDTFGRYALSQLRRIKTHRRWLLSPPHRVPSREDFGLPPHAVISRDQQGAADALLGDGRLQESDLPVNFLRLLDQERHYRTAKKEWDQFSEWQRSRNPARAALEQQFGYDTKHAMHLVRLLRMAGEILRTGEVHVVRTDAEELLAIRRGSLSFEELLATAETLGSQLSSLAASSPLPEEPDEEHLNGLCSDLVREAWTMAP